MSRISSRYRRTWPRMMATSAVSCASMNSRKPSSHVRITCKITGIVAGRYCTHDRPSARKMNMIERTTMWWCDAIVGSLSTRSNALSATVG